MNDDETSIPRSPEETLRNPTEALNSVLTRRGENPLMQWLLLTGSRLWVTAALLTIVFGSILGLALVRPIEVRTLLTETNAAQTLFSALLSGAILLASIVVSINSVVLSQEITDVEDQQERVTASMEYRRQIEDFIQADVSPARPTGFLTAVLYSISRQMAELERVAQQSAIEEFQPRVAEFSDQVEAEIDLAKGRLEEAEVGSFDVLLAGLNYNYSGQLHATRSLKRTFSDEFDEEEREAVDGLIHVLQHIATGREYFKSLYYKRELARLSSVLLYVSLPVIVFTSYMILALDANLFPEVRLLGLSPLLFSVIFAYTVALAPFVVLTAYVVRTATITLRTLSAGPFILQPGSEMESFDWEQLDETQDWEVLEQADDD